MTGNSTAYETGTLKGSGTQANDIRSHPGSRDTNLTRCLNTHAKYSIYDYFHRKRRNYTMMGKRILVIDDEPDMITYIKAILEDKGHTTFSANDAEEGMKKLKENRPDLILLDLLMPGKTGIKLFSELKKDGRLKDIPIVLITGIKDVMGGDHKKFFESLHTRVLAAYLEKPVEPWTLVRTVNEVLGLEE